MEATLTTGSRVRRITSRRAVLWRLVRADLSVKYEGSTLGYLWSVLEPLLLTAVYYFVFRVANLRTARVEPFDLFLLSGILTWNWLSGSVNGSLRALRGNRKLIGKVDMPREIFPLSVVAAKGVEYLLSLLVLVFLAIRHLHAPSIYLVAFPLALLMQLVLLTGMSLILSAANTLLRDIERVIKPLLRAVFYMSGILFPIAIVHEKIIEWTGDPDHVLWLIYRFNPVIGILELYRAIWYPESFQGWPTVGYAGIGCVLIFLAGWVLFRRLEPEILKEL